MASDESGGQVVITTATVSNAETVREDLIEFGISPEAIAVQEGEEESDG